MEDSVKIMKNYTLNIDPSVFVAPSADILGDVTIGKNCGIWYHATIRGDEYPISIGENTNVQDNAVLHVGDGNECHVGNNVTIGHSAIVHGCTIGDNTVVAAGAGRLLDNGKLAEMSVGVGDEVIYGKYSGSDVEVDGVQYKILRESDVLAKVVKTA